MNKKTLSKSNINSTSKLEKEQLERNIIREENKAQGARMLEKLAFYERLIEAYGPYFERKSGIKVQLLAEEISDTFSLKILSSLTKEKLFDIINLYIDNDTTNISESHDKIIKSQKFLAINKVESKETLFNYFIDGKENLIIYIIETYINSSSREIASIIFALINLKIINGGLLENKTHLHRLIKPVFKNPGSRQALSENLNDMSNNSSKNQVLIISKFEKELKQYL